MATTHGCPAVHVSVSGNKAFPPNLPGSNQQGTTVRAVILGILRDPVGTLFLRWNWKAAVLSSMLRASIFFVVNLTAGWEAAVGAMLAELALRSLTSGFYGAITEAFSAARPEWKATAVTMIGLPFLNHGLEFLVHWLRHTPALGASIGASMAFTSVSTAFNLYAMRRGVLTVGGGSKSLLHDLARVPVLLFHFASELSRFLLSLISFRNRP